MINEDHWANTLSGRRRVEQQCSGSVPNSSSNAVALPSPLHQYKYNGVSFTLSWWCHLLESWWSHPHSSAHLPPFCLSSSVLAPCWASAPWLTMLRFLSSMVPYNYLLFLPPQHVVYLFVSPCSHSNNLETNSCESCWSLPANSILNFPTWDLKSEGAIDLYCDDQSAFKT